MVLTKFERISISTMTSISGFFLIYIPIMGPLILDKIHYRTSQSGFYQIAGQDLANIVILAPICLMAAYTLLTQHRLSKWFTLFPAIYLIYNGIAYSIGFEWGDPRYTGNSEIYFFVFITWIITGILLLMAGLSLFTPDDAPSYKSTHLRIYVSLTTLFLFIFTMMWLGEVMEVIKTGDTVSGAYSSAPVAFWTIKALDLGISLPLGFIGMYLLLTRPKQGFTIVYLFFGFFVTQISAVLSMAIVMTVNNDPEIQSGGLAFFSLLAMIVYTGFVYLMYPKVKSTQLNMDSKVTVTV